MLNDGMPFDLIQGGLKVAKVADFKVYLLRLYTCSHKTNGDNPRQYLNCFGTDF